MTRFEATISDEAGHVRVALAGECDLAVREELTAALLAAVRRAPVVVVDLGGLDFLDSSGVHGLITAHHAARDAGRKLFVINPRDSVATVLDITGVAELLSPPAGDGRPAGSSAGEGRSPGSPAGEGRSPGSPAGDGRPAGSPARGGRSSGPLVGDGSLFSPPAGDGVQG